MGGTRQLTVSAGFGPSTSLLPPYVKEFLFFFFFFFSKLDGVLSLPRGSSGLRKRLSLGLVASHGTVPAHSPGCSSLSDGLAAPLCSAPLFAVPSF